MTVVAIVCTAGCLAVQLVGLRHIIERAAIADVARVAEVLASVIPSRDVPPDRAAPPPAVDRALLEHWEGSAHARIVRPPSSSPPSFRSPSFSSPAHGAAPRRSRSLVLHGDEAVIEVTVPLAGTTGTSLELTVPYRSASAPYRGGALMALGSTAAALSLAWLIMVARVRPRRHDDEAVRHRRDLLDRGQFQALLSAAIASRAHRSQCVLLLGLGRLREVTAALQLSSSDELVAAVADRLAGNTHLPDVVARTADDQFAVLLETSNQADVDATAATLLACLDDPFTIEGLLVVVEGNVGVAYAPDHGADAASLLQRATIALARAQDSRLAVTTFDAEHDAVVPQHLQLLGELPGAITRGELTVHYQPKLHLESGKVTGVEALVRWEHPRRGLIQPAEFIPAAERSGIVTMLTDEVLAIALAQCRRWRDEGRALTVAVNLSARSLLDEALPDHIASMVRAAGVPMSAVELELTESAVMADPARGATILNRLSRMGVTLAVDDFGTGHSSLAYLRRLPVTWLKIDRTFVSSMSSDYGAATIVRSTVGLARSLGLQVVAEGVDDIEDWRTLKRLGCDAGQGYHLSPPVPPEDIPDVIAQIERRARMLSAFPSVTAAGR